MIKIHIEKLRLRAWPLLRTFIASIFGVSLTIGAFVLTGMTEWIPLRYVTGGSVFSVVLLMGTCVVIELKK